VETSSNILESCLSTRLTRLQVLLSERQVDGLLVSDSSLRYWLGHPHAPLVFVDRGGIIECEPSQIASQIEGNGKALLGFDASLTAFQLLTLQEVLPHARWTSLAGELARLCSIKDAIEIALLRQAAIITCQVFKQIEEHLTEGCSELELLWCANDALLAAGGEAFAFDPSIAGGERSCHLWAGVSRRRLMLGEPVVIDLGASFRGYQCDMTRSYIIGGRAEALSSAWLKAYDTLEDVLLQVSAIARPGIQCGELHALCERLLKQAGFKEPMRHALGHGVGLNVHEFPTIGPDSPHILEAGMVIALEPSVTLETMGVRHEDLFLVTEDGCQILTS
jgi:Xaa-Pro aminopeptidase